MAKKTGLSKAALIERAFDYAYRKSVMEQAKKIAADIDEIVASKESRFMLRLAARCLIDYNANAVSDNLRGPQRTALELVAYKAVGTEAVSYVKK